MIEPRPRAIGSVKLEEGGLFLERRLPAKVWPALVLISIWVMGVIFPVATTLFARSP